MKLSDYRKAHVVARWNPSDAIRGWAGGCRANERHREASIYEAALAIQSRWRSRQVYGR